MSSRAPGASTFQSEVSSIGSAGFWILIGDKEFYVPFNDYPAFAGPILNASLAARHSCKQATVAQIYAMEQNSPGQLSWSQLDIDIEVAALESPEQFPLIFQ